MPLERDFTEPIESVSVQLGPAVLDLDDLDDIRELVTQRLGKPVIRVGRRYKANDIDDLKGANPVDLELVTFTSSNPYLELSLQRSLAFVRIVGGTPEQRSAAQEVASLVTERRTHFGTLSATLRLLFIAYVALFAGIFYLFYRSTPSASLSGLGFTLVVAWLILIAIMLRFAPQFTKGVRVIPVRRADRRLSSESTRRNILLMVATALTSGLISLIVGLIVGQMTK